MKLKRKIIASLTFIIIFALVFEILMLMLLPFVWEFIAGFLFSAVALFAAIKCSYLVLNYDKTEQCHNP